MKALGKHMIIELNGCNTDRINDVAEVERILTRAVEIAGATVIQPVFHKFNPHGISGVIVIAESHISIHTWPEFGYCAVDIFTCGDLIDNPKALDYIKKELKAKECQLMEVKRGILDLPPEKIKHKVE